MKRHHLMSVGMIDIKILSLFQYLTTKKNN